MLPEPLREAIGATIKHLFELWTGRAEPDEQLLAALSIDEENPIRDGSTSNSEGEEDVYDDAKPELSDFKENAASVLVAAELQHETASDWHEIQQTTHRSDSMYENDLHTLGTHSLNKSGFTVSSRLSSGGSSRPRTFRIVVDGILDSRAVLDGTNELDDILSRYSGKVESGHIPPLPAPIPFDQLLPNEQYLRKCQDLNNLLDEIADHENSHADDAQHRDHLIDQGLDLPTSDEEFEQEYREERRQLEIRRLVLLREVRRYRRLSRDQNLPIKRYRDSKAKLSAQHEVAEDTVVSDKSAQVFRTGISNIWSPSMSPSNGGPIPPWIEHEHIRRFDNGSPPPDQKAMRTKSEFTRTWVQTYSDGL